MEEQLSALRAAIQCNDLAALRAPVEDDPIEDETDNFTIAPQGSPPQQPVTIELSLEAEDTPLTDRDAAAAADDDDDDDLDGFIEVVGDTVSGDDDDDVASDDTSSSDTSADEEDEDEEESASGDSSEKVAGDEVASDNEVLLDAETMSGLATVYARGARLRAAPVSVAEVRGQEAAKRRRMQRSARHLQSFREALSLTREYEVPENCIADFEAECLAMVARSDQELLSDWLVTRIAPALRSNYFHLLVQAFKDATQAREALRVAALCSQVGNWLMQFQYALCLRLNTFARELPSSPLARFYAITTELTSAYAFSAEKRDDAKLQCALTRETVPNDSGYYVYFKCFYVDSKSGEVATRELRYFVCDDFVGLFWAWFVVARLPELVSASAQHEIIHLLTPRLRAVASEGATAFTLPQTAAEACLALDWTIPRATALLTAPNSTWMQNWLNTIYTALSYIKEKLQIVPSCSIGELVQNSIPHGI